LYAYAPIKRGVDEQGQGKEIHKIKRTPNDNRKSSKQGHREGKKGKMEREVGYDHYLPIENGKLNDQGKKGGGGPLGKRASRRERSEDPRKKENAQTSKLQKSFTSQGPKITQKQRNGEECRATRNRSQYIDTQTKMNKIFEKGQGNNKKEKNRGKQQPNVAKNKARNTSINRSRRG